MDSSEKNPLLGINDSQNAMKYREEDSSTSSSDNDWSGKSSSSYYSDSDSSVPEWDSNIQEDGELVFIVCNNIKKESAPESTSGLLSKSSDGTPLERGGFQRQSVRRSSRGKLMKILKRRNSNRSKPKSKNDASGNTADVAASKQASSQSTDNANTTTGKVTFNECHEGEIKELKMEVDFANRLRYGRRFSQMESLFGISTTAFDDGKRVMVSGILPEGQAINQKQIKIGDWLKTMDEEDITAANIDQVLSNYPQGKTQVKLVFQRVAATEVSTDTEAKGNYSDLVRHLTESNNEHEIVLSQVLRDLPVAIVYLATEGLSEDGPENEGVVYCYPRPEKHNFLCLSRGTFLTLNHLIPEILKPSKPLSSTVFVKNCLVNVAYTNEGTELMLLALPDNRCNLFELTQINNELVRVLKFCHQSLNRAFKSVENISKLDRLFSRFFAQMLSTGYGWEAQRSVQMENIIPLSKLESSPLFEQCLPLAQTVHLPWEAHLQIDDALTELEAADYREWNDDPFDCQRLFLVTGSCLYYSGHLLVSHLQDSDLVDVNSFLRLQGFLSVSRERNLQNLVVWKEVFLSSCNRGVPDHRKNELHSRGSETYKTPSGRWFIVVVGKENMLLVTLLEAGSSAMKAVGITPPLPFYVEECESCLDLLIEVGLDKFLVQWFECNARPQVVTKPEQLLPSSKGNKDFSSTLSAAFGKKNPSPVSKKSPEIQSILKRRHHSNEHINTSNAPSTISSDLQSPHHQLQDGNSGGQWARHQRALSSSNLATNLDLTYSEDSESQKSTSEVSEERVQGRRVARERENRLNRNSLSSDSDGEWDRYEANSQLSGSYDLSDLSQSLLQKMGVVLPTKISAGEENVCFHFVKLECEQGVLLSPTIDVQQSSTSELYQHILKNFRKASQKIHILLQNTIRFKKMLSPSSSVNKSLVAIKEHGILFSVPPKLMVQVSSNKKNIDSFNYWVIGRLFENEESSEVYVCHHESVSQNMVEVAFRLAFHA